MIFSVYGVVKFCDPDSSLVSCGWLWHRQQDLILVMIMTPMASWYFGDDYDTDSKLVFCESLWHRRQASVSWIMTTSTADILWIIIAPRDDCYFICTRWTWTWSHIFLWRWIGCECLIEKYQWLLIYEVPGAGWFLSARPNSVISVRRRVGFKVEADGEMRTHIRPLFTNALGRQRQGSRRKHGGYWKLRITRSQVDRPKIRVFFVVV